ncbi:TonB-dependent receptor plug domain-containing protein [Caulobacter sp. KR2-114]|uniref:TonB-dependent receptor plug domain-containing protein n=1 Tax=Caulobacter sp. KR2-114 TaxID=3400912 RepID=UPI003BFDD066
MRSIVRLGLVGGGAAAGLAAACAPAWAAEATSADTGADQASTLDELIVTGTRETTRTQFTAISPVDVVGQDQVAATASAQLGDKLTQLIPSFNVQKLPTSDGLQFVRPATLRGLSPDMTLLLVNGKRFHRSAFLGQRGSQASDLAQIPSFAAGHVEVLRDGASAQYGSDAIAGVINVILDEKPGFAAYGQASRYDFGDGATYQAGVRAGFALGDQGHLVLTGEYSHADATSRTNQRPDAIAFQAAHPTLTVANPVQHWGNPALKDYHFALDGAVPFGDVGEAYTFATVGGGHGVNDINWRNPDTNTSIYKTTAVFPGFDVRNLYPAGFTPREGIDYGDVQIVGGLRNRGAGDFTWDLSASYGRNRSSFFLDNSINASLGPQSPVDFNLGDLIQSEFNLNADASYRLKLPMLQKPVNLAFGAERRLERYQIVAGDPASYAVGPGAAAGLAPESNGFPGFADTQAGIWTQESYAAYVDAGASLTDRWSLDLAMRYEHYQSFGDSVTGKVSTRYAITPDLAVRGGYSTGFRAPTPAQLFSTSTSQGLDTVTLQLFTTGRLSPTNPVAAFLGAKPLQPETSRTYTAGAVWKNDAGFSASVDLYQIDVFKRFSQSANITVTPAIQAQLVALNIPGATSFTSINFFTNDFNTRTRGIDLTGGYEHAVGPGRLNLTAAYNYNQTRVTSGSLTANATQKVLYEQSLPRHNVTGTAVYSWGAFDLLGRVRYYGPWTDSTGNSSGDIFQRFHGIAFVDASVTWHATRSLSVRGGAENLFNTYPDKAVFQASRGLVYSRNSPYDTNGGLYYVRFDAKF